MCVSSIHLQNPQRPQKTSLRGASPPARIPPAALGVCPPVLSQPWGGGAANLTVQQKMEIRMRLCMLDGKNGLGEGKKWLPLRLGELKSPQSLERRKTLEGQKSNSQGHLREREGESERKIYQTSPPLRQIVYVVKPESCCGN